MPERELFRLSIANIAVGERIGFFNAGHAERLGASLSAEGQHAPIQVKRNGNAAKLRWTLVAGLHRLRAAEAIGWREIDAIQVADFTTSDAELRRLELAENLNHRHRRPIERAIMIAAHGRLEEAIDHPDHIGESRQRRGARMKNSASATVALAENWRERTAKAFGISLRTFNRHQTIYRAIVEEMPELAEPLNAHPLGESLRAMERLASYPLDKLRSTRRTIANKVLERDDWKSLNDVLEAAALKGSNGFRVHPDNHSAIIFNAWSKMKVPERRAYLEELPKVLTRDMAEKLAIRLALEFDL